MLSKMEYVNFAVGVQLGIEKKRADDWTLVMGRDLKYDYYTIQLFLVSVERILKEGNPSFKFTWTDEFAGDALQLSIMDLIGAINAHTK